ncbi:MAG: FAD-binding oxidoreductase [Lewinellaceae bacterium]|nr:FAD-binding oxidoreductase [Lewinellaceae bacterium]
MSKYKMRITNWGNYPAVHAEICFPETVNALRTEVLRQERLIARGNGKCYGDAALGTCMLSTLKLNKLLDFDRVNGIVHCESGILLAELLEHIVPAGWFFHVTPGIKNITVGGAIASDVHGKNHPEKGCFSNWLLSFELMRADGEILCCSKTENASLFWQTCGGMGWTGIILSAKFQLMPVSGMYMQQRTVRAENLDAVFEAFQTVENWPYAAAWIDCLAKEQRSGRGVVYFARHLETERNPTVPLAYPFAKVRNIPFFAPSGLLNRFTIRAHNYLLFNKAATGEQQIDVDRYFYPLDRMRNWNRLYGRRGFIQYQFCLPEENSLHGIRELLKIIRHSPDLPFLSVLKRHGDPAPEAVHSFPIRGYSLALDFPRTATVFSLVEKLDALVWGLGGKIYLTKDACSSAKMGRIDPTGFGEAKFHSLLKERLLKN